MNCAHCGSNSFAKNGIKQGKQIYKCKSCGREFREGEGTSESKIIEQGKDFINIVCASKRMLTKDELIREFNIDLNLWEIDRFKVKTSEGYRKDRKVKWEVKNGTVTEGSVDDTGKMLVVPLYHIEIRFVPKKKETDLRVLTEELKKDMLKFSPKYPIIKYPKDREKYLFEPDMPDLHFGKLAWAQESGDDYDLEIAERMAIKHLESLIRQAEHYKVERVLFPIGNDYFNVNSKTNTTVSGTPQQEDTRSQKTFKRGRLLAVKMIDLLTVIAPVDVLIVPGNHDEERTFYLGDSLESWYHKNPNVTINNEANKRKYYSYGKNLIGFTHGYWEKLDELPLIMSLEQPELWGKCPLREWQTGDKHHKKEIKKVMREDEQKGVMVRILRSLSANDTWHHDKGYINQRRFAEGFIRHAEHGLVSQFVSSI